MQSDRACTIAFLPRPGVVRLGAITCVFARSNPFPPIGWVETSSSATCTGVSALWTGHSPHSSSTPAATGFDLPDTVPRLVYVALRTPPMPERLLKLRLA